MVDRRENRKRIQFSHLPEQLQPNDSHRLIVFGEQRREGVHRLGRAEVVRKEVLSLWRQHQLQNALRHVWRRRRERKC
jgi:hypothetical protein